MSSGNTRAGPDNSWFIPRRVLVFVPGRSSEYATLVRDALAERARRQAHPEPAADPPVVRSAESPAQAADLCDWPDCFLGAGLEPSILLAMPHLRWVHWVWAGVDRLTMDPAFRKALADRPLLLTRTVDVFGPGIAEYVLAHCLALAWRLPETLEAQQSRQWRRVRPGRVRGKRLGVAGLGSIGAEVARLGRRVGMEVSGLTRSGEHAEVGPVFPVSRMGEFVAGLDYLVLTLPLTPETTGLVGRPVLEAMQPGSVLINVGRGAVVDEKALVTALEAGRPGHAVLDVFTEEPLPPDSPLWHLPNVTITPHISGLSQPPDVVPLFLDNLDRMTAGRPPRGRVDPDRAY